MCVIQLVKFLSKFRKRLKAYSDLIERRNEVLKRAFSKDRPEKVYEFKRLEEFMNWIFEPFLQKNYNKEEQISEETDRISEKVTYKIMELANKNEDIKE